MNRTMELVRCGYGSNFNKLYVEYSKKEINKICYNPCGYKKINSEITFYKYIKNYDTSNTLFPNILKYLENGYIMEYLENYQPLYIVYKNFKEYEIINIKKNIYTMLDFIHSLDIKETSKEKYIYNVLLEIETKNLNRYESTFYLIKDYEYIKKVNGVLVKSIPEIISIIKKHILELIEKKKKYEFVVIHGDCQFNNILCNKTNLNLKLIDPRGYFGDNLIYGIKEYDYGKIMFALSGYDEFDNRNISSLEITEDNINVHLECLDDNIYETLTLELLLMVTIWCGNFSCFLNDKNKMVYSYNIARYIGTKIINKFNLK